MPIPMSLKDYLAFKVQTEFMDRPETHTTPNLLLEDPQAVKVLKSQRKHRLFHYALILQGL